MTIDDRTSGAEFTCRAKEKTKRPADMAGLACRAPGAAVQSRPCASMASATLTKPAMLAPSM
jgi:hypothetical protein